MQIQEKILLCKFEEVVRSAKFDKEVLADKNEDDKDEIDKNEAESHIIVSFVTLAL